MVFVPKFPSSTLVDLPKFNTYLGLMAYNHLQYLHWRIRLFEFWHSPTRITVESTSSIFNIQNETMKQQYCCCDPFSQYMIKKFIISYSHL